MTVTTFSRWFEIAVVFFLGLILAIMFYWAGQLHDGVSKVKDHIEKVKADVKVLRALLSSIQKPSSCPSPGEHTTKICHYTLEIMGDLEPHHEGWKKATVPRSVLDEAKKNCEEAKAQHPEMGDHPCVDPDTYSRRDYAIQVGPNVSNGIHEFANDPVTDRLVLVQAKK
jgi:hypothetical protein